MVISSISPFENGNYSYLSQQVCFLWMPFGINLDCEYGSCYSICSPVHSDNTECPGLRGRSASIAPSMEVSLLWKLEEGCCENGTLLLWMGFFYFSHTHLPCQAPKHPRCTLELGKRCSSTTPVLSTVHHVLLFPLPATEHSTSCLSFFLLPLLFPVPGGALMFPLLQPRFLCKTGDFAKSREQGVNIDRSEEEA